MLFLEIICTQRTPIIELFLERFREVERFYRRNKNEANKLLKGLYLVFVCYCCINIRSVIPIIWSRRTQHPRSVYC